MPPIQKKFSAIGTITILAIASAIDIAAQSTAPANGLAAKQNTIAETKETSAEKKSGPAAEGTDLPRAPATVSKTSPGSETPDSTKLRPQTAEDESRDAAKKTTAPSQQTFLSDEWQFQVTPYVWLPGLHGTAGIGNRTTAVDESFTDLFHALDFVFMGTFEARKGRWISVTDFEYVSVSDDKATPGPLFSSARAKLKDVLIDPMVGYRVYVNTDKGVVVDVLGGVRILHLHTDLDFGAGILPAVDVQASRNWVDAIGGLRGRVRLSEKFYLTSRADLGGGGSKFTYQVFGAVGYNVREKLVLVFGYRLLSIDYNKNNFIYDITQRGPILGLGFRF